MLKYGSIGLCALLFLVGCVSKQEKQSSAPQFVIVNVLDKELFDDCHIKGSVNVPFEDLASYALEHWDKENTEIVVHCSNYSCTASGDGYKLLKNAGFKKVWAFEGGTAQAMHEGIAVEGPCASSYLKEYEKPELYQSKSSVEEITVENLKKKIENLR